MMMHFQAHFDSIEISWTEYNRPHFSPVIQKLREFIEFNHYQRGLSFLSLTLESLFSAALLQHLRHRPVIAE